ncbi:MAG TPA: DNA/RNA nuclease SfsA [Firmicutes bacterium]|nr:DNA/RNA nuclease SfsA [Candidatus Fermentithermobacillaceae bacterium]
MQASCDSRSLSIPLGHLEEATVISRLNRFVALVNLKGREVQAHVADSGRLKELLFPGNRVMIRKVLEENYSAAGTERKTRYDLVLAQYARGSYAEPTKAGSPTSNTSNTEAQDTVKEKHPCYKPSGVSVGCTGDSVDPGKIASRDPLDGETGMGRSFSGKPIWVSVDTRYPNRLFEQALVTRKLAQFERYTSVRREYAVGNLTATELTGASPEPSRGKDPRTTGSRKIGSRIDFLLEGPDIPPALVEVKSVTLCRNGIGLFPDAPTERAVRHLRELTEAIQAGYYPYIIFIAQREDVRAVAANKETDPVFAKALEEAYLAGVKVLAYRCKVSPQEIRLDPSILPILFEDGYHLPG